MGARDPAKTAFGSFRSHSGAVQESVARALAWRRPRLDQGLLPTPLPTARPTPQRESRFPVITDAALSTVHALAAAVCTQIWLPPPRFRWCTQIPLPPHSLHCRCIRPCLQMAIPPQCLYSLGRAPCSQRASLRPITSALTVTLHL